MESVRSNVLDASTFTTLCKLFNVKRIIPDAQPCSEEIAAFFEMFGPNDLQTMEGIEQFLQRTCLDKFFKVVYRDPMDFHWKFTKFIQRQTTYGHYPLEGQHRGIPCSDLASGIFGQDRKAYKVVEQNLIERQKHVENVVQRKEFSPIYKTCVYHMCTNIPKDGDISVKDITSLGASELQQVMNQFKLSLKAYIFAGMTSQDAAAKTIDPQWNDLILSATIETSQQDTYRSLDFDNFWADETDKGKEPEYWQYNWNGSLVVKSVAKSLKKMTPLLRNFEGTSTISISEAEANMISKITQTKGSNLWLTGAKTIKYKSGVPSTTIGPIATLIHHCSLAEAGMSMLEEFCRCTPGEVKVRQRVLVKASDIPRYVQFEGQFITDVIIRTAEFAKDQVIRSLQRQYETNRDILQTTSMDKRNGPKDFRAYFLRRVSIGLVCSITYDILATFVRYGMNPEVTPGKSDEFLNYVK
jgi:hypothetical protein